jgi:hypothetical protein
MTYNIIVFINDGSRAILTVNYERDYDLRRDVTNIGVNGLLQKLENKYQYFPPHKIDKIEVEEELKQ